MEWFSRSRGLVSVSATAFIIATIVAMPSTAAGANSGSEPLPVPAPVSLCDLLGAGSGTENKCSTRLFATLLEDQPDLPPAVIRPAPAPAGADLGFEQGDLAGGSPSPSPTLASEDQPESRDYADVNAAEARQALSSNFSELVGQLATGDPSDLPIIASSSDTSAVIDPKSGPNLLIDSTAPVTTPGPSDAPINLSLTRDGATFAPENALVETSFPEVASDPAELQASGIGISYDSESNRESTGAPIADRGALFYHDVDEDTDLVTTPTMTGLEVFAQLRSHASPTTLHFDVQLPTGATMEAGETSGSLDIVRRDELLAEILSPTAVDAEGTAVPISMSAEPGGLRLSVGLDHDTALPVLVDPEVVDNYNWPAGASFGGWTSYGTDPDFERWAFSSYFTPGLYNLAPNGRNYASGSVSDWYYRVPNASNPSGTSAYISDAILKDVQFVAPYDSPAYRPRMVIGLWSKYERWVRMFDWATSFNFAGDLSIATWTALQSGTSANESQRLDFQLYVPADGVSANPTQYRTGRLSNVEIRLADPEAPTVVASGLSGWTNGASSIPVHADVTDPGLGVKVENLVPGYDEAGNLLAGIDTRTLSCSGTATSPCSRTSSRDYSINPQALRQGVQLALPVAWDAVGQGSFAGAWYGIDRTAPSLSEGTASEPDASGALTLSMKATDGDPGTRNYSDQSDLAGAQSGVQSMKLLVNGTPLSGSTATQTCPGDGIDGNGDPTAEVPWGSCGMAHTVTVPAALIANQSNSFQVEVKDVAGNVATPSVTQLIRGTTEADLRQDANSWVSRPILDPVPDPAPSISEVPSGYDIVNADWYDGTIAKSPAQGFAMDLGQSIVQTLPMNTPQTSVDTQAAGSDAVAAGALEPATSTTYLAKEDAIVTSTTLNNAQAPTTLEWKIEVPTGENYSLTSQGGVATAELAAPTSQVDPATQVDYSATATDASGSPVTTTVGTPGDKKKLSVQVQLPPGVAYPVTVKTRADKRVPHVVTPPVSNPPPSPPDPLRQDGGCGLHGPSAPFSTGYTVQTYAVVDCVFGSGYQDHIRSVELTVCLQHKGRRNGQVQTIEDKCKSPSYPTAPKIFETPTVIATCRGHGYETVADMKVDIKFWPDGHFHFEPNSKTFC